MAAERWSDEENDLIVADYFAMRTKEISGQDIGKAHHRLALVPLLQGRSKGSVEFKHQNISAILEGLGEEWIDGYKPARNFQATLVDAVQRWLEHNPAWFDQPTPPRPSAGMREGPLLWIGAAPAMRNEQPTKQSDRLLDIARRFDFAGRDERNRKLGQAGEECVLEYEMRSLTDLGRSDLARQIRWVSRDDGDGAGYDIASFMPDGRDRLIEVKTTNRRDRTPFYISRNELAVAERRRDAWCLVRLWNFSRNPQAFELRPPLDARVALTPTTFEASFC